MIRLIFLILFSFIIGCKANELGVNNSSSGIALRRSAFIMAIKQQNVERINTLLISSCGFKQYVNMENWYGFYRNGGLIIGPFPLKNYKDPNTLNLKTSKTNESISSVFFENFPIYFDFSKEKVQILGEYK